MKISRRTLAAGVPAVAMADIAFNLVLFFIMMAKTQDDSHFQWQPASTPVVQRSDISKVSVVVDTEQNVYFNGQPIFNGVEIDDEKLKQAVETLKKSVESELRDLPAGKRTVLLKIDKATTARVFEPVVEAVSEAGGEIMHILEERRVKSAD